MVPVHPDRPAPDLAIPGARRPSEPGLPGGPEHPANAVRPLDPDPEAVGPPSRRSRAGLALPVLAFCAAWMIMLVRPTGLSAVNVIWAEDGSRFLGQALRDAGPAVWFVPYGGYLHLIPRLLGWVAAHLPLLAAALVLGVGSAAVAAAALTLFAAGLRRWLPRAWQRSLLVVVVVLAHALGGEVAANAANLHWFLTLGLLGLALLRPGSARTALVASVVAAGFGLSDFLVIVVVPIAVGDAALRWRRAGPARSAVATWAVATAMTVTAAAQAVAVLTGARPPGRDRYSLHDVPVLYLRKVLMAGIAPRVGELAPGDVVAVAFVLACLALGAACWRSGARGRRALLAASGVMALSWLVLGLNIHVNGWYGERYSAVPAALFVTGLLLLVAGAVRGDRARVGDAVLLAVAVVLIVAESGSFVTHPGRSAGPAWVPTVRAAAVIQCAHGDRALIPIAPRGWALSVPCDRLRP